MCMECYVDENRITPLLNPLDCLENHTQYICGTCGRCICIEHDPKRGLQRWNFPFKSLEIAKLYLRTADYSTKKSCGIYELKSENGRLSYKIFADSEDLLLYLKKNKGKTCKDMKPVFMIEEYREYANTQIRKLTSDEIQKYMSESSYVCSNSVLDRNLVTASSAGSLEWTKNILKSLNVYSDKKITAFYNYYSTGNVKYYDELLK